MSKRTNKNSGALAIAEQLGVKLGNIEEVYEGIKSYERIDDLHLTLREFAGLAGLKYKRVLSDVSTAALENRFDEVSPDIAMYLRLYEGRFEVYKGRGQRKVEFRVAVGTTKAELLVKIQAIVAKRKLSSIWVDPLTKAKLEAVAAKIGMDIPDTIDHILISAGCMKGHE